MQSVAESPQSMVRAASLVVFGAGGNIGSHSVPLIGRMPGLLEVTLVDRDIYEEKNLQSQAITRRDIGRPKATVQARRLRAINPALAVAATCAPLENVPFGRFRASLLLSCLDSRVARQWVNEIAFRLNVPWIDAGVEPSGLLARVTVYFPGRDAPCLECLWDERDYALLEQAHPCDGKSVAVAPTNAPASLGALAAALQAIECQKLLTAAPGAATAGTEQVLDASFGKHFVTRLHRNPRCRFDHESWTIERTLPASITLTELVKIAAATGHEPRMLRVAGRRFVADMRCTKCAVAAPLRVVGTANAVCHRCGADIIVPGSAVTEHLDIDALPAALRRRSLRTIGVRSGDLIGLRTQLGERYFEVGHLAPTSRVHHQNRGGREDGRSVRRLSPQTV